MNNNGYNPFLVRMSNPAMSDRGTKYLLLYHLLVKYCVASLYCFTLLNPNMFNNIHLNVPYSQGFHTTSTKAHEGEKRNIIRIKSTMHILPDLHTALNYIVNDVFFLQSHCTRKINKIKHDVLPCTTLVLPQLRFTLLDHFFSFTLFCLDVCAMECAGSVRVFLGVCYSSN